MNPIDVIEGRAKWSANQGEVPQCLAPFADLFDTCVCDPPYELGFMGKSWDASGVAFRPETWAAVLQALKPGGYLLAFGGSRTYHRIAVAIEDAGFEIRDTIAWCYGSGFPKSLDVGKAIDAAAGATREVVGEKISPDGVPYSERKKSFQTAGSADGWKRPSDANPRTDVTAPATPDAAKWSGWGTALKPAYEPIIVARRPLVGTVAANVLQFGTGAINVDGCRVGSESRPVMVRTSTVVAATAMAGESTGATSSGEMTTTGRWPPNLILSHAAGCERVGEKRVKRNLIDATANVIEGEGRFGTMGGSRSLGTAEETVADWRCVEGCPVKLMGEQSGERPSGGGIKNPVGSRPYGSDRTWSVSETTGLGTPGIGGDTGTAARFFPQFEADPFYYCAKASRSEREAGLSHLPPRTGAQAVEREEGSAGLQSPRAGAGRTAAHVRNFHPTVKPIALMRWLVRLVCREGGIVLDPFMGSGTTGCAAMEERMRFVGFDLEPPHVEIARGRIGYAVKSRQPIQHGLFEASK